MGMEPGTWAAIGAITSALVGGASAVHSMTQKAPKGGGSSAGMPAPDEASPNQARQNLDEQEKLRLRRGRASTMLQGEGLAGQVATTQSGGKTLLGA